MNNLFFLLTFLCLTGCTTTPEDQLEVAALTEQVAELGERDDFSGIYWIANQDSVLFEAAYGYANLKSQIPISADTRFNLASMNKLFTAATIMRLRDAGQLKLNEVVATYLPDLSNLSIRDSVTIEQLLTHTSGVGDMFTSAFEQADPNSIRSLDDYLDKFIDEPLLFPPGTEFGYSNGGYIILGKIIEAVTGEDYYSYVQREIFDQLGMTNTGWYSGDSLYATVATAYMELDSAGEREENPYLVMKGSSAGGGYSSVSDLLLYGRALMDGKVVSKQTLAEMSEDRFQHEYGYGLTVKTLNGHLLYGHNGGFPGVSGELDIFPDLGLFAVSLSNRGPRDGWASVRSLVRNAIVGSTTESNGILNANILVATYTEQGLDAALAQLETMNGEVTVNQLMSASERFDKSGERAKAIDILKICITADTLNFFPVSVAADLQIQQGDTITAIQNWKKSLVLNKNNQWAKDRLKELEQ